MRIKVLCAVLCVGYASLAVWAYRISATVIAPAAAQGARSADGNRTAVATLTAPEREPAQPGAMAAGAGATVNVPINTRDDIGGLPAKSGQAVPHTPPPVTPILISRVAPDAAVAERYSERLVPDTALQDILPEDADEWAANPPFAPGRDDTFRTVCVRLCDGATTPISFATTRSRFRADAARCQSGCSSPARLFVSKPDGDLEDLVDVHGSAYVDLPNAFKFRTSYDAACTCRGQPWEAAEIARHSQYAATEQALLSSGKGHADASPRAAETAGVQRRSVHDASSSAVAAPVASNITTATAERTDFRIAALDPALPPRTDPARVDQRAAAEGQPGAKASKTAKATTGAKAADKGMPAAATITAGVKPAIGAEASKAGKKHGAAHISVARATMIVRQTQRTVLAQADPSQRAFNAADYWRLSVLEPRN